MASSRFHVEPPEELSMLTPTGRKIYCDLKSEIEKYHTANKMCCQDEGIVQQKPQGQGSLDRSRIAGRDSKTMALKLPRISETSVTLSQKETYILHDFLNLNDENFITNAYRHILKRSPDSNGYGHYLTALRQGRFAKVEVLGRLRFSPEGRRQGVKIKGLLLPFILQSCYRIPVLGHLTALTSYTLRLPVIIKNFLRFEASVNRELLEIRRQFNANSEEIENSVWTLYEAKADRGELSTLSQNKADRSELSTLSQNKADRSELSTLSQSKADRGELESIAARKANREEVEALGQSKADRSDVAEIFRQIKDHKRNILDQQRRLGLLLEEARKRLPEPLSAQQIEKMVLEEDHLLDAMYVNFEDQFRGTREDIKKRLKIYLPFIKESGAGTADFPVLDIGCGRGEWLELLKENGLRSWGVDLNRVMISQCVERGLDVKEKEAFACLRALPTNSIGAVTGMHIIEHLPFRRIVTLFDETLRVLTPGGVAIFETPNPENLIVGACNFYLDPTHQKPLPPHSIAFLIEARGFVRVNVLRLHPFESFKEAVLTCPEINHLFAGPQDYGVVAYRAV